VVHLCAWVLFGCKLVETIKQQQKKTFKTISSKRIKVKLGLGTSAGIGERKSEVSGHRDVTNKSAGKFKGKLTNGFLANVYSPVSQKEQIKTMKEQKVCCML